jgi:hypothetical protein
VSVRFDADSHTLSIAPAKAMLSEVLREISRQSGVEMRLDPAEDREIDVAMKQQPLDDALRGLARQNRLNFVMGHVRDSNGQQQLVSFAVLREGEMSAADIPPLDISSAPKQPGMGELRKQRLAAAASMKKDDSSEKKERKAVDEERKKKRQAAREQREAEKAGHEKQRNAARRDKKEDDVARLKARHEEEMARLKRENPKKWEKRQARLEEQRSKRQADAQPPSSTATKTD